MDSEPSGCLRALVLPVIAGDMGGLSESGGGCLFLLVLPLAALTCSCAQRLGRLGRLRRRPYNPPEAGLPRGYPPPPPGGLEGITGNALELRTPLMRKE